MLPFTNYPMLRGHQVQRDLAILFFVVIACAFPFLSQPFHMDDNFYMDMARNARSSPMYPNDTPYVFEGRYLPDMGSHSHPPLQTYFLALIQRLAGEGPGTEWIYHTCALIYPILAVTAFYFASARFLERPFWPALVLAVSPLFLVMQHTLMTDVPALSFWLAAIAAFVWATALRRRSLYVTSSVFQFAAMFTSYQSFALAPLLGFYYLRRGKGIAGWIALVAPLAAVAGWFALNFFHYGRFLLGDTAGFIQSRNPVSLAALGTKLVALLQYQGWLILFPFFFLYLLARGLRGRLLALAGLAAVYLAQIAIPHYGVVGKAIFALGLVTGGFILGRMALFLNQSFYATGETGFSPPDAQFLSLWYFGVAACCLLIFTEGSARYILPLVPPLLIYFFRQLEVLEVSEYRRERPPLLNSAMMASGAFVVSLAWGLALSHADQEFARVYPRAAREFSQVKPEVEKYYGGEWGFRYYFGRAGARQLPTDESLVQGGSLLILPRLALPYDVPAGLKSMLVGFQSLTYDVRTPLRLLDRQSHAGFYSTGWGLLPFSLSRKNVELVEIRQVDFMVERLPWAQIASVKPPWPGYLSLQGQGPLAILAHPATRIAYSWTAPHLLSLEMKCGVSPESYAEGTQTSFEFEIVQLNARGEILADFRKTLYPGLRKEDRQWQPVRLSLRSRAEGGETLEFRYTVNPESASGVGAFAECSLRAAK